jgi:BioD-like phosphotransacetylase family protein
LRQADQLPYVVSAASDLLDHLSPDVQVLFVETDPSSPFSAGQLDVFRQADAVSLIVARYQAEDLFSAVRGQIESFNQPANLVVFSAVPDKGLRLVQQKVAPAMREFGITVMGVIPQDRILTGLTVGELAENLGADVLCAVDQLDLPVEAVMISAMSDEGAEEYFRRIPRKAVVAGGDRPDIHMPALATDTSCIVLTEGHDPDPTVFRTAEQQGVPLLKVTPSTVDTLDHISEALGRARFRQSHKVGRAVALYNASIDDVALFRDLGVAPREVAR